MKSGEENSMVNGVEGCRQVKESKKRDFARIGCKEEVVENVE